MQAEENQLWRPCSAVQSQCGVTAADMMTCKQQSGVNKDVPQCKHSNFITCLSDQFAFTTKSTQ